MVLKSKPRSIAFLSYQGIYSRDFIHQKDAREHLGRPGHLQLRYRARSIPANPHVSDEAEDWKKKSLYSNFLKGLRYFMNPKISLARTRFLEIANFQWKNTSATVASSGWTRKKMMAAAIAPPACRGGRNTESWSYDLSFFSCGTECYWTSLKFSLKYIYIWIH